jgi:oligopeptide transport system ATP-binding protein
MSQPLLVVKNLETQFKTQDGIVKAVNNVSFHVDRGETLGIVGESGSGKSVTSLSIMRLIPNPPGRIVGGQIIFDGDNLLDYTEEEMRHIRGNRIAMIFQDPMTSLNPVLTIGRQITESLELHMKLTPRERATGRSNCCRWSVFQALHGVSMTTRISSPAECASA